MMTKVQKYLRLFEGKYRNDKEQEDYFYSFNLEAIVSDSPEYRKMSSLIHQAEVSPDYAYQFTVEALEAITEILATHNLEGNKTTELDGHFLDSPDIISQYSQAPVYTSEILAWFSAGTSHIAWVEEAMDKYGGKNQEGKTDLILSIQLGYTTAWEEHYFKVLEAIKEEDKETETIQQFA